MPSKFRKAFLAGLAAGNLYGATGDFKEPAPKPAVTAQRTNRTNAKIIFDAYINDLIRHEGSIAYQRSKGMYRNGKFYPYKDTLGHMTIGYGHKILPNEDFKDGITESEAKRMLQNDATQAWRDAMHLLREHNVRLTDDQRETVMRILPNMIFQLGKQGVRNFKNMWKALEANDFKTASKEMLDSKWAKSDSPNRANELARKMKVIPQTR